MKKRKRILTKLSLFFVMALLCIISFVVPTKAYYVDNDTGNVISNNLIDVDDLSLSSPNYLFGTYELENPISVGSYCFSFEFDGVSSSSQFYVLDSNLNGVYNVIKDVENGTNIFSFDLSRTGYFIRIYSNAIGSYSNFMFNSGDYIGFEPYGTYYSQINYNNYGSSQYSQGYTEGYNSIYNNLVDVNLSNQINGFGVGIYDSTGETFIQRATISSSGVENNYYYINFNSMQDNYYVVNIGFNDSYLITGFSIQTAMVSNPSLEANGNMLGVSSNYGYNGSTYGWHTISFNEPVNLITFRFQNTRDIGQLKFYINGKRLNVLDALESYQEGLENGKEIGYNNGYAQGYSQGSKDNMEITSSGFKVLFNSILSYPVNFFKTVFNFEFMGINIAGLITFIISLVIVGFIWNKFRK